MESLDEGCATPPPVAPDTLQLNPFSIITETANELIINSSIKNSARFSKRNRPFVDLLMRGQRLSVEQIQRFIAPARMKELEDKRILLRGNAPEAVGRYSRQLGFFSLLSDDHNALHQRLRNAHVLILGAGAIGSHVSWNLAAMGVGRLTLVDFDVVEESNLNRQLMYTPADLGKVKVEVLARKIMDFNPTIDVEGINARINSPSDIRKYMDGVDLVVKAIDSPETSSSWVNAVCVEARIPYVQGGFVDYTGVVGPNYFPDDASCAACVIPDPNFKRLHGTGPTFAPLATLVSSLLATLAFKALAGQLSDRVRSKIFEFDFERYDWRSTDLACVKECDVCGASPTAPSVSRPPQRARNLQRVCYLLLMAVIVLVRNVFNEGAVSLIGLVATVLWIPLITLAERNQETPVRRELFLTATSYVVLSVGGALLFDTVRAHPSLPTSVEQWAGTMQTICATLLQMCAAIAVLFLLFCGLQRRVFSHFLKEAS